MTDKNYEYPISGQKYETGTLERDAGVLIDDPTFDKPYISFENVARLSGLTLYIFFFAKFINPGFKVRW
jgi:hypothetical protein